MIRTVPPSTSSITPTLHDLHFNVGIDPHNCNVGRTPKGFSDSRHLHFLVRASHKRPSSSLDRRDSLVHIARDKTRRMHGPIHFFQAILVAGSLHLNDELTGDVASDRGRNQHRCRNEENTRKGVHFRRV